MILKGSQRSGGEQLAAHLLNDIENDHVTLHELRGFMAEDLAGALSEAHAISKATHCKQFMFSLSLNPPKDADCTVEQLIEAVDRAEQALGLTNQPRGIVIHEKKGRRHAHVVWSRIEADEMKALPMPFFKNKLTSLSKELYLEHGWELPEGHRENGWRNPLNFTLAEWQQAKRLGLDPREIKTLFADTWRNSDGAKSFQAALQDRGYFLARGDRRGFVAVDIQGEVFAVARMIGVKTKEVEARLGSPDNLPSVDEVKDRIERSISHQMRTKVRDVREAQREARAPILEERARVVVAQRSERERLKRGQDERWKRETRERQQRFRKGVRGLFDVLTGRAASMRRENERDAYDGHLRDVEQREALYRAQSREREAFHERLTEMRRAQRKALMALRGHIGRLIGERERGGTRERGRELTFPGP